MPLRKITRSIPQGHVGVTGLRIVAQTPHSDLQRVHRLVPIPIITAHPVAIGIFDVQRPYRVQDAPLVSLELGKRKAVSFQKLG